MKTYRVKVSPEAKADLRRYRDYLLNRKKSPQAAKNVVKDFYETAAVLETIATSLQEPDNEKLRFRKLKRINFLKHDYFLLYRIDGNVVSVTNMFHSLEDFENKLT